MWRKLFAPAVLSLALTFMAVENADAQRWGRGFRGGYPGAYRGGWYGGYRPYYYGAYRPYYYGYPYSYPYYSTYSVPYYYSVPVPSVVPVPVPTPVPAPVTATAAQVHVYLPDPLARVWLNDTLMPQTGIERVLTTQPIYEATSYRVRAAWMQGSQEVMQERIVSVTPGADAVVDFR